MDIAALSMVMSQSKAQSAVGMAVAWLWIATRKCLPLRSIHFMEVPQQVVRKSKIHASSYELASFLYIKEYYNS